MLLDNKTKTEDNEHYKVFDFIKAFTEEGALDIVTGYFSVNALALMKDEINSASALEKQVDALGYKLYELTDEEVRIVEGE
jgi:predicted acetyltransferase